MSVIDDSHTRADRPVPLGATVAHRTVAASFTSPGSTAEWLAQAQALAGAGPASGLPMELLGNPGAVLARMYHAQALDIPIWHTIQDTFVVDGQIGMKAALMRGLILRSGHSYTIDRADEEACWMTLYRHDDPQPRPVAWTIEEAEVAGLLDDPKLEHWWRYPKDMLVARCSSRMARGYAPDSVAGFGYTKEELVAASSGDAAPATPELDDAVAEVVAAATAADVTPGKLQKLSKEAAARGLMNQFTDEDGPAEGARLRAWIHDRWIALTGGMPAVAAKAAPTPAAAPAAPVRGMDGNNLMKCGKCKYMEFITNGDHNPDCAQRVAPVKEQS